LDIFYGSTVGRTEGRTEGSPEASLRGSPGPLARGSFASLLKSEIYINEYKHF